MTPSARITSGLLLAVAVVSVAFLFKTTSSGPDAYLFGGESFSQDEVNEMVAAMAGAGLSGWNTEGNRIKVSAGIEQEAIAAIASAGALPESFSSYMDRVFSEASPMESRRAFELRTKTARENQLSHLLASMPWVAKGHVVVDIAERQGLNRKNSASATVFVDPKPGEMIDQSRSRNIQRMVAGAFQSLSVDNVNITNLGDDSFTANEPWFEDPYLRERDALQKSYKKKLLDGLSWIPGVRIEVSAVLNNMESQTVTETTPNETKVVRSTTESETEDSRQNDRGGRPGLVPNGPGRNGADEGINRENSTKIARDSTQEESVPGWTQTTERHQGFRPDELYASIAIPRDYLVAIWKQKNPDGDPTTITDTDMNSMESKLKIEVEGYVQNVLPRLALGKDEYRQVEVVYYDAVKRDVPEGPSMAETAMTWTSRNWGSLSMLGLAMVSLLMLRSALKPSETPNSADAALQIDFGTDQQAAASKAEEEERDRPRLKIKKSESLKEDLSDMVRDDPDAAANILRAWINNAS